MIIRMILACAEPTAPPAVAMDGWAADLARDPKAFARLVDGAREGWAALHAHQYTEAFASGGAVARRAAEAEASWRADEARLVGTSAEKLYAVWSTRPGVAPSPWLAGAATLAATCTGVGDAAGWRQQVTEPDFARALESPAEWTGADPLGTRMALHRQARAGAPEVLLAAAVLPIWTEDLPGFQRKFLDPCVAATLRDVWAARADALPPVTDLAADVFTGRAKGLPGFPRPGTDVPERAREAVQQLDAAVAAWQAELLAVADDDGRSLLLDLRLLEVLRQQWLIGRGRELLAASRPQEALATLESAIDPLADGGPTDPPALWVLLAHARVATGRTREALDALEHLRGGHPDLAAVAELVGDLAVLQGMDRQGDSKEH